MITPSASTLDEKLHFLGIKAKGIFNITSFSSGLRSYAVQQIIRWARKGKRTLRHVNARTNASAPALLYRILHPDPPEKTFHSNLDAILSAAESLDRSVVIIEHAEEFLALTHYPGCKNLFRELKESILRSKNCWIFMWMSSNRIPENLIHSAGIIPLPNLTSRQLKHFLKQNGLSVSGDLFETYAHQLTAFPEYAIPFFRHANIRTRSSRPLQEVIHEQLRDNTSCISLICESKWLEIIMLAKGFGALKSILAALAHHPRSRLTDIARFVTNSLPATKDYLNALITIGAVVRKDRFYYISDPFFADWIKIRTEVSPAKHIFISKEIRKEDTANYSRPGIQQKRHSRNDDFLEYD